VNLGDSKNALRSINTIGSHILEYLEQLLINNSEVLKEGNNRENYW
jgi:hypothetical protein